MNNVISRYYKKYSSPFIRNLGLLISAMLRTGSSNTSKLASAMHIDTKESFKANDMRIYRFLKEEEFQVDDRSWRCHVNMVFDASEERNIIHIGDRILLKVDYTTSTDNFLILMASVDFNGRSIPLFFTMRNYPKKHNQMDQKKMETAFIKGLQHILPKKYRYTLVADRGFGNDRFAELCQQNGFDYVLRINDNLGLSVEGKKVNLETFAGSDFDIETEVLSWRKTRRFVGCTKGEKHWILMTNLSDKKGAITSFYEQRFGIEMGFKDQPVLISNNRKLGNMIGSNVCFFVYAWRKF